jgi:Uma2 family endonuclease
MGDAAVAKVSYADYLAEEEAAEQKHEFHDGEIVAMAGASVEHARLAAELGFLLSSGVRGRGCTVYSSDLRIRIDEVNRTHYADLTVVCGPVERSPVDAEGVTNPRVVVEVLSDSTEAYDRGEKFRNYRRLASLTEYVLVSQREPVIEVYRRTEGGWLLEEHGPGQRVRLGSIGVEIGVDEVFGRAG